MATFSLANLPTARHTSSAALPVSSSVVYRPVENRTVPMANSIGILIASKTLEIVMESL
jgi:hypothetical protein